jgi:hypothetical protein
LYKEIYPQKVIEQSRELTYNYSIMRMTSMEKRRIQVAAQEFEDDMDMDELDFHMSMVLEAMEDHLKELQSLHCKIKKMKNPYKMTAFLEHSEMKLEEMCTKMVLDLELGKEPGKEPGKVKELAKVECEEIYLA